LEIVGNGNVVAEVALAGNRTTLSTTLELPVRASGWYLLRARGNRPTYPILDVYPYATTSPIYVTVGGAPVRSSTDAQYFIAWIDRLQQAAEANRDWNTSTEKSQVLTTLRRARDEFVRLSQ
jgi:TolB protein